MSNAVLYIATGPASREGFKARTSYAQVVQGTQAQTLDPVVSAKHSNDNSFALTALIHHAQAVVSAIEGSERVSVCCDSDWLVKGLTSWIKGWEQNGWMTKGGTPVKMKEQWLQARALLRSLGGVISYASTTDEEPLAYLVALNTGAPTSVMIVDEPEFAVPFEPPKPRVLLPTQGLW